MKGLFPKRLGLTELSTFLWTFFTSKVNSVTVGQPVRVTLFDGVSFRHAKAVTRLAGLINSLKRGELFRRFHLQTRQNADEIESAGDNLCVESDSPSSPGLHMKASILYHG